MKRLKRSLLALAAALVLAAVVPASAEANGTMFSAEKSSGQKETYNAYVGASYTLGVRDGSGSYVSIDRWKSTNTDVITVSKMDSKTGLMNTLKKGKAKVYAYKNGEKVAEFSFSVISGMSVSGKSVSVEKGKSKTVKATLEFVGDVKASSSDKSICTVKVTQTGYNTANVKLTGVKAGSTTVKVKNSETKEVVTIKVTVTKPAVMSLSSKNVSVKKGASVTVKGTLTKSGTFKATVADKNICSVKITKVDSKHAKLKITGKKAGSTYITVKNSVNSESIKLKVTVTSASAKSVRRALVIGQGYEGCSGVSALPASLADGKAMKRVLSKTGYSEVTLIQDASKNKIKSYITKAFADADSDDVSFLYYSGHGASDGSLCSNEGSTYGIISPAELAGWLKKVPGKVVVVCDSCYSGQLINKNGKSADDLFVEAFAKEDVTMKSGELCSSKFEVITASSKTQMSWCNQEYGYFTYLLIAGVGYNYDDGKKQSSAPADKDKNGKLTTYESWKFASDQLKGVSFNGYYQDPKCYPAKSSFTMFQR